MSVRHVWHLPLNVAVVLLLVVVLVVVVFVVVAAAAAAIDGQTKFAVEKLMQHLDKVGE